MLAERFGYDAAHLADLDCVYEYWNGGGFPGRVSGEAITLPARIVHAVTLAVAAKQQAGVTAASTILVASSGSRVEPALAAAMLKDVGGLLDPVDQETSLWDAAVAAEPVTARPIDEGAVDETPARSRTSSTSSHRTCVGIRLESRRWPPPPPNAADFRRRMWRPCAAQGGCTTSAGSA